MDENDFIYGRSAAAETDRVLVKMYVPKRLKRALDSLKLARGKNLQQLAAEALEQYLDRELKHTAS